MIPVTAQDYRKNPPLCRRMIILKEVKLQGGRHEVAGRVPASCDLSEFRIIVLLHGGGGEGDGFLYYSMTSDKFGAIGHGIIHIHTRLRISDVILSK